MKRRLAEGCIIDLDKIISISKHIGSREIRIDYDAGADDTWFEDFETVEERDAAFEEVCKQWSEEK